MKRLFLNFRPRIKENRIFGDSLILNRAERVEPWPENIMNQVKKNIDFPKLGYYYDLDSFQNKYANYLKVIPNQLLLTNGADGAIRSLYNIYVGNNDHVMYPDPTYAMYNAYSKMYKSTSVLLEHDQDFKINRKQIYDNLSKTKIFFLPNPNHWQDNFEKDEIRYLCERLNKTGSILVSDETYYGFGSASMIPLLSEYKNLYVIRSFSKTFGLPGLRLGCLLSHENISIANYRGGYEIPYLTSVIGEYFLNNIDMIDDYNKRCVEGRTFLIKSMHELGLKYNGDKSYIFNIVFDDDKTAKQIHSYLWNNQVYTRQFKNTIGITIGPIEYMKRFMNVLDNKLNIRYI